MNLRALPFVALLLFPLFATAAPFGVQAATPGPQAAPAITATGDALQVVFDGGLKGGWQDWGWAHRTIENDKPARLQFNKYAGWILGKRGLKGNFKNLQFSMKAPASFGEFLEVHLAGENDDSLPRVRITAAKTRALDDGWLEVSVAFTELNPSGQPFDRIKLRAAKNVGDDWVQIDKIVMFPGALVDTRALAEAKLQGPKRRVKMRIDCRASASPISPYIYGTAFVPRHAGGDNFQWEMSPSIRRWGGNPASRYNWQLGNAWNTASDWFYQNVNYTNDASYSWKDFLAENKSHKVTAAITVPMLGWVAKDTDSQSFPVSQYGPQQYSQKDAGNGMRKGGGKITGNDPKQTSIASTPAWSGAWVEAIEQNGGGVTQYILDNEPALWNSTHRDVHPDALTYDELLDKTIAYGTEVRKHAPKAMIAGPAEWGWPGYFFSAKDAEVGFSAKPDRRAHGDVPLLNYYLRKLAAHEKKTGVRILDVVDLHYYPQTKGLYGGGERVDAASAAARIRATRSLWDPTYKDESWIKENIQLLPRLKGIIAQEYPGLKISLGEYNFGGEKHISGALALAESLGRFGQAGVYSAYYWTYPPANSCAFYAFRAYRNYDGHGSQFLDQSIPTTMAEGASLFASRDAQNQKLTAVALNLDAKDVLDADIELIGCGAYKMAKTYSYDGGPDGLQASPTAPKLESQSVNQALAPYSITVFELTR